MQFEQAGAYILEKLKNELPHYLYYHNIEHTQDVYLAAEHIGRQEGVPAYEMKLLLTAAWYHDAGFLEGAHAHEETSCRIASEILPGYGYTEGETDRICGLIRATRIPQAPQHQLEMILADADLDYLGRNDFFSTGAKLFAELLALGTLSTEYEWNQVQVRFLENHHYFTKTALKNRQAQKDAHLLIVKSKIK